MKYRGKLYDAGDEDGVEIRDVIVRDDKIALDWSQENELFNAVLRSTDGGVRYTGHFGTPKPEEAAVMEATRFQNKNGEVLLLLEWHRTDTGHGGISFVRLTAS